MQAHRVQLNYGRFHSGLTTIWLLLTASFPIVASASENPSAAADQSDFFASEWRYVLGPFYATSEQDTVSRSSYFMLFSKEENPLIEQTEWDFLYPLASYDRYGKEWRLHLLQLVNFSGGSSQSNRWNRTTVFPFYFREESDDPAREYRALLPFYGTLKNRLLHDEIKTVAFPCYIQFRKRDVVTEYWLMPLFHRRKGEGLNGWHLWPLGGWETKEITTRTNVIGEEVLVPGHRKLTVGWPFYLRDKKGLGTDNPESYRALLPLFSSLRSPQRNSFTAPWPIGITLTTDHKREYREIGVPWPFVVFAWGEGKRISRLWPLFGSAANRSLTSRFFAWPLYRSQQLETDYYITRRNRLLLFLYRDNRTVNKQDGTESRRSYFWPLFSIKKTAAGDRDFRMLSLIEPLLSANQTVDRHYFPALTVWRNRFNPATKESFRSLLWGLYSRRADEEKTRGKALFGLVHWERSASRKSLKILGIELRRQR